jgi:DNA-directed RNA polymerase subunit RPC12/RpoP
MLTANDPAAVQDVVVAHGHACAACGAPVDDGDSFCNACGTPQPTARRPAPTGTGGKAVPEEPPPRVFRCQNCGAEVEVDPKQLSYVCPFCESTYVVELPAEQVARQRPEFVIGFAVTPDQAAERFEKWIKQGSWIRPGDLRQAKVDERLRGVYLPFWSFSMLAQTRWDATIGEHWYRTETYTTVENGKTVTRTRQVQETEWWPLSGKHHRYYSGYLVSGSRGLPQTYADSIKPFQTAALKRYEPYFLAGWLAEQYSIERDAAEQICRQEFQRWVQQHVEEFLPGDTSRGLNCDTEFSHINSDLILLPIYLLTYRYNNKQYRFLINGQTGRTYGEKPISWQRIALAVVAVLLVIAAIVLAVNFLG